MMGLKVVEVEEFAKEATHRQAKAAEKVAAEDDELVGLQHRQDLPLVREVRLPSRHGSQ